MGHSRGVGRTTATSGLPRAEIFVEAVYGRQELIEVIEVVLGTLPSSVAHRL